jgi:acyl-CoA dehydrogenase
MEDSMYGFDITEEQKGLIDTTRRFTRERIIPVAGQYDEEEKFPEELFHEAHALGLANLEVPQEYGGMGLSCLDHCLVLEELSYGCVGIQTTFAANMLGAMPLIIAGTEEQKQKYLGAHQRAHLRRLRLLRARRRQRRRGPQHPLRAPRRRVRASPARSAGSPTPTRRWFTVLATKDKALKHKGITCFVVDADTPGVKIGRHEKKLGQRASYTCDILWRRCASRRAPSSAARATASRSP